MAAFKIFTWLHGCMAKWRKPSFSVSFFSVSIYRVSVVQDPAFRAKMARRWSTLRQGPMSDEEFRGLIINTTSAITPAAVRNYR